MHTHYRSTPHILSALALGWLVCASTPVYAADDMKVKLYGSIVGFVTGPSGIGQMGATVSLVNKYDQPVQRTLTNERGAFGFDSLTPDSYTIRVTQTSFAPASKNGIRVDPGERSFLSIQLASLVSSIQLIYAAPGASSLMTDDWKWVLRSSTGTRPVLRYLPVDRTKIPIDQPDSKQDKHQIFTDVHGVLSLSAGEMGNAQSTSIADMGTAFALSTSVFGTNHLMLSGNLGYSPANGLPAAGFRTSFRRMEDPDSPWNPEIKLTVQQVFLPMHSRERFGGGGLSDIRSMSTGFSDQVRLSENVTVEGGASLDSISVLSKMTYVSPFALLSINLNEWGSIEAGFSSGIPQTEMYRSRRGMLRNEGGTNLHQNVSALSLMPRISMRDGNMRVQRTENFEITYHKQLGSRTFSAGVFRESLTNAALTMASNGFFPNDAIPDFNSNSAIFNIGDFARTGFSIAGTQRFGDLLSLSLIMSNGGVLRTDQRVLSSDQAQAIRQSIRQSRQNAVSAMISGSIPKLGTQYAMSYQWTDYRSLTPGHLFLTNLSSPDAGLNFSIRQRVPAPSFMAGRMEISAEMRNLMAQGYLPLETADGRRLLLIHTPRALRGGISFFF